MGNRERFALGNDIERAREYRATADKLRALADEAQDPAVKAELSWLAQSYGRLADQVEHGEERPRVAEDARSLEVPKRTGR
jgi:HAMP domain-containing protein